MKKSILRNMFIAYIGFGLLLGISFPFFANFFVIWKEGMYLGFTISCLVAGLIMGLATFQMMKVMLINKLEKISKVATAISNKDLTFTCVIESEDVIGNIINSFNLMQENLRNIIDELRINSHQIEESVCRLSKVSTETADGAESQSAQIQHIQSAVGSLKDMVQSDTAMIHEAMELSENAKKNVNRGNQVISKTGQVIQLLSDHFSETSSTIEKLKEETENIGSVLDVIRGISDQTNLLALNAAIEAARAGEQGRGFAVVADEVRTLAQRTQESTLTIQEMIEALQKRANSAEQLTKASSKEAASGVDIVHKAEESLEQITQVMNAMNSMNSEIQQSADMQLVLVDEINTNVIKVSDIAQQSQVGADDSAEQSNQLSVMSRKLEDMFEMFITTPKDSEIS